MARTSRFSQEVRERAVRMVFEHRGEYDSEWEAICSIAEKIGCSIVGLPRVGGLHHRYVWREAA